jgi:imidazolonepropionase-like amidohydrolase
MNNYVVIGKKLFDGNKIIEDYYFIVEEDKIVEVGNRSDKKFSSTMKVVDMGEKVVTPGLMDCHIHIFGDPYNMHIKQIGNASPSTLTAIAINNLKELLSQGIVYIRDVGAPKSLGYEIRNLVKSGLVKGPDLKVAGEAICITGGHGYQISKECDGADEVRKAVRENIKQGADLIKIMVTGGITTPGPELAPCEMSMDEISVAVEEAHKKNRKVAVHTHGATGIKLCLEAGVDSIEHGLLMNEDLSKIAAEKGIFTVPTLSAPHFAAMYGMKNNPKSKSHEKSKSVIVVHNKNILNAYNNGAKIAMGTDSGTPFNGFDTALEELVLLNNIGISTENVFKISTKNSAELLEIADTHGTLEAGKQATFVVFDNDPFIDINNIKGTKQVYKNGIRVF